MYTLRLRHTYNVVAVWLCRCPMRSRIDQTIHHGGRFSGSVAFVLLHIDRSIRTNCVAVHISSFFVAGITSTTILLVLVLVFETVLALTSFLTGMYWYATAGSSQCGPKYSHGSIRKQPSFYIALLLSICSTAYSDELDAASDFRVR